MLSIGRGLRALLSLTLAITALAVSVPTLAAPRPCVVTVGGARYGTLQSAVDAAPPSSVITVHGRCIGPTVITKRLTVQGKASHRYGTPTLDGGGANVVSTSATITLRDLTITGGGTGIVAGRKSDETIRPIVTVRRVRIRDNDRGVDLDIGRLVLRDSAVYRNSGLGLRAEESSVTLSDSIIHDNAGGIDSHRTPLFLRRSHVYDNDDGGISMGGDGLSVTTLEDSTIHDNGGHGISSLLGGGIVVRDSSIDHNRGGVFSVDSGPLTLAGDTSIDHNTGDGVFAEGAAVRIQGRSSIHHNSGAGIVVQNGTVVDCGRSTSIHHNRSYGIFVSSRGNLQTACMAGGTVHDNTPADFFDGRV